MVLICTSLLTNEVGYLFMCLCIISASFVKCPNVFPVHQVACLIAF